MTVKQELIKAIDQLPDDCTFEDAHYKLYVIEKVRRGLEQLDRGEGVTDEVATQRMAKWLID
ncbi:MAG: hypothetical protein JO353_01405 [Phycisphaerae bacterium]|nr:hypothetical protein [Phycisphaerae bacterium]